MKAATLMSFPLKAVCLLALVAALAMARAARSTPSFDCKAAASAVEVLICSSQYLSAQDSQLASAYRWVIAHAVDRQRTLAQQREWLRSRSATCSLAGHHAPSPGMESFRAAVCLFELYGERITALQRSMGELPNPQPPIRVEAITAAEAQRAVVNSLQRELPRFYSAAAVQVTSCDQAINYTQLDLAGHDYSYAARCEVKIDGQEASVLMCDDALVGKWHIARDPGGMGRDQLAEFVRNNCPPGG